MAKQYMLPLLHRLANLRTEVATGRTRRNYGVGRELTGEELSWRKTEIAGTVDWAGEKNVRSAYACPALRLLGTPRLSTRLGDSSAVAAIKNFGVAWRMRGPPKKTGPVEKEWRPGGQLRPGFAFSSFKKISCAKPARRWPRTPAQRLAPPPQHLVLLRQLSDPCAPP